MGRDTRHIYGCYICRARYPCRLDFLRFSFILWFRYLKLSSSKAIAARVRKANDLVRITWRINKPFLCPGHSPLRRRAGSVDRTCPFQSTSSLERLKLAFDIKEENNFSTCCIKFFERLHSIFRIWLSKLEPQRRRVVIVEFLPLKLFFRNLRFRFWLEGDEGDRSDWINFSGLLGKLQDGAFKAWIVNLWFCRKDCRLFYNLIDQLWIDRQSLISVYEETVPLYGLKRRRSSLCFTSEGSPETKRVLTSSFW